MVVWSNIKKGVRLEGVSKIYSDPKTKKPFKAVDSIDLDIRPGDFVTLLGPSGCGKDHPAHDRGI